jgi:uncharacterized protein YbjT (DUF2867 family)
VRRILVTGATGYIGGRLVPRLLDHGYHVRCLARDPQRLDGRSWRDRVDVVEGDLLQPATLGAALRDIDGAYYLVHSMRAGGEFAQRDVAAARACPRPAATSGLRRIVYLGGLGDPKTDLSAHLRSRHTTGLALREAGVPVCELRAAVVVGSGSISFEMIRYLTERLPVMVCPRWVYVRAQPIGVDDVLSYLVAALESPGAADSAVEIGGADVLTYGAMMLGYAKVRGLHRRLLSVPVLTPRLSSYWVDLVTPIPSSVSRALIEGLRNEVVVRDRRAAELFSEVRPIGYEEAVGCALAELEDGTVATSWTDALASSERAEPYLAHAAPYARLESREGLIVERRRATVQAPPARVFAVVSGVGGGRGWPYLDILWRLRGLADRLVGGVGMRRGRRDPDELRTGDALDFWRVEEIEPDRLIRLRAEMKVPGRAWLQFEVAPAGDATQSSLVQTAFFAPKGLAGLAYWYLLYPVHRAIFSGMIAELTRRAALPAGADHALSR